MLAENTPATCTKCPFQGTDKEWLHHDCNLVRRDDQIVNLTRVLRKTKVKVEALKEGDPLDSILLGITNGLALFGASNLAVEQLEHRLRQCPHGRYVALGNCMRCKVEADRA